MPTALLSGSPILDVDATFFIYFGVFWLLFFMLRSFVFQPTMALFDEREKAIDGAKAEARKLEKTAEEKLEAFEGEMAKVRAEVGVERDKMRAEATTQERVELEKVRAETDKIVAEAEAEMAKQAAEIRAEIAKSSPVLARQIAEKLLGREVQA